MYIQEYNKTEIETKTTNIKNNKEKIKYEIETLKAEYKVLLNQKIKDLTSSTNEYQKQTIENTYKELETAIKCFYEIIASEIPNKYVLENIINQIWIYSNKTVKFDLKVDIEKLI